MIAEDSDKKYDQVSQKLSALEVEAERADDRLSDDQARIMELTEEYKVVADNMKSLEASEAVAWPRRNLSRKSSAISPKGSRMPRHAPARVKSSHLHLPKTQKSPRKNLAAGWTNMPPSIASLRPLTTKCPDIREPLTTKSTISHRDHPFISSFFSFHYINEWCGFFPNFYIHNTNVSRSFYHPDTFFIVRSDCRRYVVFFFALQVYERSKCCPLINFVEFVEYNCLRVKKK